MILRVFRFDAKDDYEFYYKPYEISVDTQDSLRDLLVKASQQDRYLPLPQDDFWLKIDGCVVNSASRAIDWIKDDEITLQPLSERCAKLDFVMDDREFKAVYDFYFAPLFGQSEWGEYAELEHLFYATSARDVRPEYIGDSAIIFAAKMMEKHPAKHEELRQIIYGEFGLRYAQDLRSFLHENGQMYEGIKNQLKAEE